MNSLNTSEDEEGMLIDFDGFPIKDDPIGYPDLKVVVIPQHPPKVTITNDTFSHWSGALQTLWDFLGNNVMAPIGIFKQPWVRPGPVWRGTWLWDNAFHSKIWSLTNFELARYILDMHMSFQFLKEWEDTDNYGRVPHSILTNSISNWTQPPLMAWAYWELFKKNGEISMIKNAFSPLFSFHLWLNQNRDLNKDGLYSWIHGFESGLDNAPRYDSISPKECNAVDLSCCVSVQLRSLVYMSEILKDDVSKRNLEARKQELDSWINTDLWDDATGFYYDKTFTGELVGPKMITGWYPLFAGIVPKDRLAGYLKHLTDKREFWTEFPVPSVARDEEEFDLEMDMWRGPTWINSNYMIIKGLKQYGFRQVPGELAYKTVKTVFNIFNEREMFYEYYGSLGNDKIEDFARKGEFNGPRQYFIGWTGLVANLLLEDIIGLETQFDSILINPSTSATFVKELGPNHINGRLPRIKGWDQDLINFKVTFKPKNLIEYELELTKPMDVLVVDFMTKEKLYTGDDVDIIQIEVENNKDTISILSNTPEKI